MKSATFKKLSGVHAGDWQAYYCAEVGFFIMRDVEKEYEFPEREIVGPMDLRDLNEKIRHMQTQQPRQPRLPQKPSQQPQQPSPSPQQLAQQLYIDTIKRGKAQ